jgi:hypothetical protein
MNGEGMKHAKPTRANPPLTQKQMTDLVMAKEWRTILDKFPGNHADFLSDPDTPTGTEIVNILKPLLRPV